MNTKTYPTATAALVANQRQGYNTVLVRKGLLADSSSSAGRPVGHHCLVAVYTYHPIQEFSDGSNMHRLGSFATISCSCKSKSHILSNVALRSLAIQKIESTRFGVQAISPHAPSLGLALEGRFQLLEDGTFGHVYSAVSP